MNLDSKENEYTGHLVKFIRKSLGLKQYQIVDDSITRNLISLVENNKAPLTQNTAKIIISCINEHAKSRQLALRISEQDLRVEGAYLAKVKVYDYLKKIEELKSDEINIMDDMIQELNLMFSQHDLEELKSKTYEKVGDYYIKASDSKKANIYYSRAYESVRHTAPLSDRLSIISNLMRSYIYLADYPEVVRYALIAESICPSRDHPKFKTMLFNKALALRYLGEYKNAITVLNLLLPNYSDFTERQRFDIEILKANCLRYDNQFDDAHDLYMGILKNPLTKIETAILYANLLEFYQVSGDKTAMKKTLNSISDCIPYFSDSPFYACQILMDMSTAYIFLAEYKEAMKSLLRGLALAKISKNLEMVIQAIIMLIQEEFNDIISVDEIYISCIELINLNLLKKQDHNIFKIIRYFNEQGKTTYVSNILLHLEKYYEGVN